MTPHIQEILARLRAAEDELAQGIDVQQQRWRYRLHDNRVQFERDVREAHRRLKQGLLAFFRTSNLGNVLTAPFIYSMIVPLALLDVWISVYQFVCFPIYGIQRVPRRKYLVVDRHKLAYLNAIEKTNCVYCGYANGLIAYVREIAGRTEQYWCPIKHARRAAGPHAHYHEFVDYGDAAGYRRELPVLREELGRPCQRDSATPDRGGPR